MRKHVVLIHGAWSRGRQLADARSAFEHHGFTVHTPTLRHHELPLPDGAARIATLSLRDYADDLVELVASLDSAPLLVGHSLGGLLVQLVAARTRHIGVVAACPSPVGPVGLNRTTAGLSMRHALRPRPWTKPVAPPSWPRFRTGIAGAQSAGAAREMFDDLVCESGRVLFFELALPWLDRSKVARVDYPAVTGPVLVLGGEYDRIVGSAIARQTASRYRNGTYVEIPGSDHLVFSARVLPATMARISEWIAHNQLFATA
ncbi:Alpha/beta hydrolase family protein [Mycobacterium marinum]|uniref:Alpha/beta hydrolase family protein n=2 Tax=Mycobacterium ulcerans group TaxID=2993898 RepID=A0A2Z5YC10_MYCMR|nr:MULTISPECIES: alpha/beta hydrolase [Mycobacterium ulcerans group]AXN43629.1 Alpha/beta hydrolase family protein [Mycobacterium marinum]AXN48996.1 Alpha/beta hydrolase family protein [Mycobacterium marinum]EPQ79279.1 hypothetical protein MMEU_5276 [Mycobacterium marinum str. Europe]QYL29851.1 Alpha/beta hydrolase family protein [Mycobacterium shottsii]RFZ02088.1 Alpha/beta hydrolase family protein [Mycobacterium marinum]